MCSGGQQVDVVSPRCRQSGCDAIAHYCFRTDIYYRALAAVHALLGLLRHAPQRMLGTLQHGACCWEPFNGTIGAFIELSNTKLHLSIKHRGSGLLSDCHSVTATARRARTGRLPPARGPHSRVGLHDAVGRVRCGRAPLFWPLLCRCGVSPSSLVALHAMPGHAGLPRLGAVRACTARFRVRRALCSAVAADRKAVQLC